jgi:WD40 repeat protein
MHRTLWSRAVLASGLLAPLASAHALGCSGSPPPPVETPVLVPTVAPAPSAAAAPVPTPCGDADKQRARVAGLLRDGKLHRALRVIELADRLCPSSASVSAADRSAITAELGGAANGSSPTGDALYERGLAELEAGRTSSAQRFFDRSIAALEREARAVPEQAETRLTIEVPNGILGSIEDVAWATVGTQRYLLVSHDEKVSIFDGSSFRLRARLSGKQRVASLAVSPDGKTLATGGLDALRLWDIESGKLLLEREDPLGAVAWSLDGKTLVVADRYESYIAIWDAATRTSRREIRPMSLPPPKAGRVAPPEPKPVHVQSIAVSEKGDLVGAGLGDGSARVWRSRDGKEWRTFTGFTSSILSVTFTRDGKLFIAADQDSVHVYALATGKERFVYPLGFSGRVTLLPDQRTLSISTVKGVIFWDVTTGKEIRRFDGVTPNAMAVEAGGGRFAATESHGVIVWDLASGAEVTRIERHAPGVRAVAWVPGSTTFVSGSWDETVRVWDTETGTLRHTFRDEDSVHSVAASPDGKLVAAGTTASTTTLLRLATGERADRWDDSIGWINSLAFDPGGTRLLLGSEDKVVSVIELATRVRHDMTLKTGAVNSVAWSPDGKWIAAGTQKSTLHLCDASSLVELASANMGNSVSSLMWSPDGATLLAAENEAVIFDTRGGNLMKTRELTGHEGWVQAVAYRPDGKVAATGSSDRTVRLWDVATTTLLHTMKGHEGLVESVAFQPDGKRLISGAEDGSIRVWSVADGREILAFRAVENTEDGYALTPGPEARIELFGKAGREFPLCRLGVKSYRFALCQERFEVRGLAAKVLAGDESYLDP